MDAARDSPPESTRSYSLIGWRPSSLENQMLFGQEHVKRYRETDGAEGHEWHGTTVLSLRPPAGVPEIERRRR